MFKKITNVGTVVLAFKLLLDLDRNNCCQKSIKWSFSEKFSCRRYSNLNSTMLNEIIQANEKFQENLVD